MISLDFIGYGGSFNMGVLNDLETENLKKIYSYFSDDIFEDLCIFPEIISNNYKDNYSFSEILDIWSLSDIVSVQIKNTDQILNQNNFQYCSIKPNFKLENNKFYLQSQIVEKGYFFSCDINVEPDDFKPELLTIEVLDLKETWFATSVISSIKYDGVDILLNYDESSTHTKESYQHITYFDEKNKFNRFFSNTKSSIKTIENIDVTALVLKFLEITKDNVDKIHFNNGELLYLSKYLEDLIPFDKLISLWLKDKSHIQLTLKNNMVDDINHIIFRKIQLEKPEWLI